MSTARDTHTQSERTEIGIDASGRTLGRVASEAAHALLGKTSPSFARHTVARVRVVVRNASKLAVSDRRLDGKVYTRYSGYPGGLKRETLREVIEKKGVAEALRRAVLRMLPKNRIRGERMKNLVIEE